MRSGGFVESKHAPRRVDALGQTQTGERFGQVDDLMQRWLPVTERLSVKPEEARHAAARSLANRTEFLAELLVSGRVDELQLFKAIAGELGLPFEPVVDASTLMVQEAHRLAALKSRLGLPIALVKQPDGDMGYVLARMDIDLPAMRSRLQRHPRLAARLKIAPPSALRAAVLARTRRRLLFDAQYDLLLRSPHFSARIVPNAWQGACVGALLVAFPLFFITAPQATLLVLHIVATAAFFSCIALRVCALSAAQPLRLRQQPLVDPADLPVYSVLVALYREREVIPQLLVSLGKLQWPHSKLEIKLVCEEDDHETLAALRAHRLRHFIEIIEVPPGAPRTKPKALAYALPLCSGEFVSLFDAEDRPHPLQLVEAWRRFRAEDEGLACLQAPLVATNGSARPLSMMFAFEYAGLFRGILPWLASMNLLLPLGGTSNHFRRAPLVEAGGWDPYNVTEDADLGVRLKRLGYRTGVISLPTLEDAPEDLKTWLPQRIRWFKGWFQTWLVHIRNPLALYREFGSTSFVVAQILLFGMLVSALIHPVFLITILYATAKLTIVGSIRSLEALMLAIGFANIVCGYGAFIVVGAMTLSLRERRWLGKIVLLTPVHWILLSLAAWLALWEIYWRPHHWHKTPHPRARSFSKVLEPSEAPATARQ